MTLRDLRPANDEITAATTNPRGEHLQDKRTEQGARLRGAPRGGTDTWHE